MEAVKTRNFAAYEQAPMVEKAAKQVHRRCHCWPVTAGPTHLRSFILQSQLALMLRTNCHSKDYISLKMFCNVQGHFDCLQLSLVIGLLDPLQSSTSNPGSCRMPGSRSLPGSPLATTFGMRFARTMICWPRDQANADDAVMTRWTWLELAVFCLDQYPEAIPAPIQLPSAWS